MFRPALALLTGVAAVCLASLAVAQAPAEPSADALFDEGSSLLKEGKTEQACLKLAESQAIEPAIGTLGLLAFCHEQSGKLATAWREYGQVAELARIAGQAPREKVARERSAELAQRVTRLAVQLSQPEDEVRVWLDARRLEPIELSAPTPIDAGSYDLRVEAPGLRPWSQRISVPADGSTLRVVVPRLQPREAPSEAVSPTPARPEPRRGTSLRRGATWASFALGGVGAAAGGYFGLTAMSARSDARPHCEGNVCDQAGVDARERALDRARLSTVAFTVAAIGISAGVVLLLTEEHEPQQTATLAATPGGASLSWERRF
jgi:hypothetical protein